MSGLRVLVVDDDPSCRLVLRATVQKLGYECVLAEDGDEAWRLIEAGPPDVLITDWMMPGLDGPELCRRARAMSGDRYTYVILATALGEHDNVIQGMEAGADDYLTKPISPFDVRARLVAAKRVTDLYRELGRLRSVLADQARTDELTGLGNRLRLHEDLERLHDAAVRYGRGYCVAICDIDDFKLYNDTYGHLAGDQALARVGRLLSEQSRSSDTAYRYGGEEFLIILADQTLETARTGMERLRGAVEALGIEHSTSRAAEVLTISVGIAAWTHECLDTPTTVLERADASLYRSKRLGRNRVSVADASDLPAPVGATDRET